MAKTTIDRKRIAKWLYDKETDSTTPLADTILMSIIGLAGSFFLGLMIPLSLAMFLVYTCIFYFAATLNFRYRCTEAARKRKEKEGQFDL